MRKLITAAACLVAVSAIAAAIEVSPLVEPYLRIQAALAADRLDTIGDDARALGAEAGKLGPDAETIQSAAGELAKATDLALARAAFSRVGDALMTLVKASGASLGDGVKIAYCPMARKYWLQRGEAIRNPFYGGSMLECGRLVAAIPDLKK